MYLDYAATTPMSQQAIESYARVASDVIGNASSIHGDGRKARATVNKARRTVARAIGAPANDVLFTSGGTESNNFLLRGLAKANVSRGRHLVTTAIEHASVLETFRRLEREGFHVTYVAPNEEGVVAVEAIEQVLTEETTLVSVMYGNNEVGTKQPIEAIGELLRKRDVLLHTDAVQALSVETLDVDTLSVDAMSLSGHKIGGPKGIGVAYVRSGVAIEPFQVGGNQERKRRGGTENVPAIAALGTAVEQNEATKASRVATYETYRTIMLETFEREGISFSVNGTDALAHIVNVSFEGVDVETLLVRLDMERISVSSGSACTAGTVEPSHVLVAMYGEADERTRNSVRISFGEQLTEAGVAQAAATIARVVLRMNEKREGSL